MRRLHCVFQDGLILGIWMCPDERFYYHIAEADATEPLTKEEIWEMLDYAVAFHKGTGTVNYFWDVIAEVGKPDNVFEGFNGRKTIIAASGLDYPVSHVKKLGELAVKANAERMRNKKSTRAKLGSLELPEVDITEQKEEPTKKRMTKLELLKKRRGQ